MQRVNSPRGIWRRNTNFFLTASVVVVTDQLSKLWIRSNLALGESLPETGFLRLTYVRNSGAAFGLFQDHSLLLIIVAIIGIATILFLVLFIYRRFDFVDTTPGRLSLGLILGGTVGNLIDRLGAGYVTDFIDVGIWPAFNAADSAVVIGASLLAYSLIQLTKGSERSNGQAT